MRFSMLTRSMLGQWITVLSGLALVMAPFGCETHSLLQIAPDADEQCGWFVNTDQAADALLGARAPGGASLLAYGAFNENGDIEKITALRLRDAEGGESFIGLDEQGWPVHLEIADGSYAQIKYTVQTETHVAGEIRLYNAVDQTEETRAFEVDLEQTLETLSAELEQWSSEQLEVLPDPNARTVTGNPKAGQRHGEVLMYPLFLLPFIAMAYLVSYVAVAILNAVAAVVTVIIQATLLAVFAPIFLLAEVTNAGLFLPLFWVDLPLVFGPIPPVPSWVLI